MGSAEQMMPKVLRSDVQWAGKGLVDGEAAVLRGAARLGTAVGPGIVTGLGAMQPSSSEALIETLADCRPKVWTELS